MPVEITVGPPVLTINQGSTFMVTDLNGNIAPQSEQGIFVGDTRFLSSDTITVNDQPWERLSSSVTSHHAVRIHLSNPLITSEDGDILPGTVGLVVHRAAGHGIHEDLDLTNYGLTPVRFNLEIALQSDFADLFEVKWHKFVRRGRIETHWDQDNSELHASYTSQSFHRRLIYRLRKSDSPPHYANGRITFEVEIAPGATWHTCCYAILVQDDRFHVPVYGCAHEARDTELDHLNRRWLSRATGVTSSNEDISRLYRQSVEDMGALRLHDHDLGPDMWLPAAGVPWFVTIFGRDSLIASLQNMMVEPGLARGALKKLGQWQATEHDDWRDAEPGKILHELRVGELAHFHKVPHTPYYGTADATPLYLIVLHEAWKWLGDDALLHEHRETAQRCLEWIDRYGDLDGDGFQEYQTRSSLGYENVGWKDAGDAVVYPDGSQVKQPKALCELQGYVFDAWMRMAEVCDAFGEPARAAELAGRPKNYRPALRNASGARSSASTPSASIPGRSR